MLKGVNEYIFMIFILQMFIEVYVVFVFLYVVVNFGGCLLIYIIFCVILLIVMFIIDVGYLDIGLCWYIRCLGLVNGQKIWVLQVYIEKFVVFW